MLKILSAQGGITTRCRKLEPILLQAIRSLTWGEFKILIKGRFDLFSSCQLLAYEMIILSVEHDNIKKIFELYNSFFSTTFLFGRGDDTPARVCADGKKLIAVDDTLLRRLSFVFLNAIETAGSFARLNF